MSYDVAKKPLQLSLYLIDFSVLRTAQNLSTGDGAKRNHAKFFTLRKALAQIAD